jgi:RNA polymerase subunit RPABC4/transcription elongation factor Spt4
MYCSQCGKSIQWDSRFCRYCGVPIAPEEGKAQSEASAQEAPPASAVESAASAVASIACPACAEEVDSSAKLCPFCGQDLRPGAAIRPTLAKSRLPRTGLSGLTQRLADRGVGPWLLLAGGALVSVGAVLPFLGEVSPFAPLFGLIVKSGVPAGIWGLRLGVLLFLLGAFGAAARPLARPVSYVTLIASLILLGLGIEQVRRTLTFDTPVGVGVWVILLGAATAFIASLVLLAGRDSGRFAPGLVRWILVVATAIPTAVALGYGFKNARLVAQAAEQVLSDDSSVAREPELNQEYAHCVEDLWLWVSRLVDGTTTIEDAAYQFGQQSWEFQTIMDLYPVTHTTAIQYGVEEAARQLSEIVGVQCEEQYGPPGV